MVKCDRNIKGKLFIAKSKDVPLVKPILFEATSCNKPQGLSSGTFFGKVIEDGKKARKESAFLLKKWKISKL